MGKGKGKGKIKRKRSSCNSRQGKWDVGRLSRNMCRLHSGLEDNIVSHTFWTFDVNSIDVPQVLFKFNKTHKHFRETLHTVNVSPN